MKIQVDQTWVNRNTLREVTVKSVDKLNVEYCYKDGNQKRDIVIDKREFSKLYYLI